MKLKLTIDNLKTENSLLKYKLSSENKNNANVLENNIIHKSNILEEKQNENIDKNYTELINKNIENEKIIKKLEEENNNLKLNIIKTNIDVNSPYNFLIKELELISKDKCELQNKLDTLIKDKNDTITKYAHINLENEKLKTENNFLKNINQNLNNDIQKCKFDDLQKTKEETELLKNKINDLEKEKTEKNEKLNEFKKKFNHDYGVSKKIRLILNFLNNNNEIMEKKINEYNIYKEKNEKQKSELQQIIKEKNIIIELKNKIIEDNKKKLNDEIFKYTQLNIEYMNLLDTNKELNNNNINENNDKDTNIRRSFSDLSLCLNKFKEILPFLNNKLENIEKENKLLKDEKNKLKLDTNNKNNELIKIKDKEIEDLKNEIKK